MNRKEYNSDPRYAKVLEKMDLLGIMDITTTRQHKNGTIVWKLPIKNQWNNGSLIEVASFKTGYVRNQNSCYSNYQLNKCKKAVEYWPDHEWKTLDNGDYVQEKTGKYRKFVTKKRILIPIEIDILLKKWIPVNTIIREEVREAIIQMKMEAMSRAYSSGHKAGVEAGLDYKLNTNTNG